MKFISNNKGFTLIEAVVVIVIFSIVVLIWRFYSRDSVKLAMMNEGKMFVEKIVAQEKFYMSEKGAFIKSPGTSAVSRMEELFLDTRSNKYYKSFKIELASAGSGTNKSHKLTITLYPDKTKVKDLDGYYVTGTYTSADDKIEYEEHYG